jgi:tetratricopeptide (TPR) repeat protein
MHRPDRLARLARLLGLVAVSAGLLALVPATAASGQPTDGEPSTFTLAEEAFGRGDFARAVDLYERAREEGVDHAFLHFHLGYALHVLGRVEEALPHHLRGVSINNREVRVDCIYNAACAHALLGHADEALRYLQYAIDAGFKDEEQVAADSDLDSLRDDDRFIALIEGIGVEPTLFEQLDFMVGTWRMDNGDGHTNHYRFERPSPHSSAITYQVWSPGRFAWVGSLVPNPVDRTWELAYCNDVGTTYRFVGTHADGSVVFRGRGEDVGGPGVEIRVTFAPGADGTLVEHAEVSQDGESWRVHHEVVLEREPPVQETPEIGP